MENVIDKIEGSKMWNYVAIGSGLFFIGGLIWMGKEIYESKQAKKAAALALAEFEKAKEAAGIEESGEKESFSGCSGCSSSATGVKTKEKPQHGLVSSDFSGLSYRQKLSTKPTYPINVPTTNPPTPCGNGGSVHWDSWGGGTKVCRGANATV